MKVTIGLINATLCLLKRLTMPKNPIFALQTTNIVKQSTIATLTILSILIIDQVVKFYVKLNIPYLDGFDILGLSWAKIHFIENEGMAFGMKFGGVIGKYALSIFRILMVGMLVYILRSLIREKVSNWFVFLFSLIIAGAVGNIIDSMFYGIIFSESLFHGGVATLFPEGGGYAPFLQGRVVDMFHFPMIHSTFPSWMPIWGGQPFEFFSPIFNVADAAISVGVIAILLFQRDIFLKKT
jgi:signal peptidase II